MSHTQKTDLRVRRTVRADPPHRVKQLRKLARWTQQELAEKAGVGKSSVERFEKGIEGIEVNNAQLIEAALKVRLGNHVVGELFKRPARSDIPVLIGIDREKTKQAPTGESGRASDSTKHPSRHIRTDAKYLLQPLHQIPNSPRDLTGRSEKVAELVKLIEQKAEDIVGLYGMGGVGKTALALKTIESLGGNYDFHFYVDLKGLTEDPVLPSHVMASVIRAHYPATVLPRKTDELAGFYQSVLYRRNAILLFDNARDALQVTPLLPPLGNLVIVTSRSRISLPGMSLHEVACLLPDDAEALVLRLETRIGIHAKQIAKLCGYLPLALRAAGSTISETIDLDPADYVRQLSNLQARMALKEPGTDFSVDSSLALSYRFLGTDKLRRCFRLLAVFPTSFDRSAAGCILRLDPESAQKTLALLVRHSVVGYDRNASRYRLHDLVRLFAGARLSQKE